MNGNPLVTSDPIRSAAATAPTSVEVGGERRASLAGAGIAAAICLLIAVIGWAIQPDTGWIIGVVGLPMVTILAWRSAPAVVAASTRTKVARHAVGLAVRTIVLTDVVITGLIALLFLVSSVGQGSGESMVWALVVVFYGLVAIPVAGIPLLVIVVPAALVWAALVRTAIR
jgi:hypothetical protein